MCGINDDHKTAVQEGTYLHESPGVVATTTMNSDSPVPLCAVEMGGEAAGRLLVMAGETTAGWLLVMAGETTAGRLLVMAGETTAGRLLVMAGETAGRFPITGGEVRQTDSTLMSPWCKRSSVTPLDINIAGL